MEKEKIREVVIRELMLTRFWNSHPSTMKDLEDSLVEALHQALSMSGVRTSCLKEVFEMWFKCESEKEFIRWVKGQLHES